MSNVVHKLLRPVKFEDKNYEMIPLDLDSLSGRDIKEAKKEFELANPQKVSFVLSADSDFAAYLAARASKLPEHPLNLEQLQVLNQEIITAGLAAYDYKWKTRDEIDDAKTKEDLAKIKIKFVPVDFTAA